MPNTFFVKEKEEMKKFTMKLAYGTFESLER